MIQQVPNWAIEKYCEHKKETNPERKGKVGTASYLFKSNQMDHHPRN